MISHQRLPSPPGARADVQAALEQVAHSGGVPLLRLHQRPRHPQRMAGLALRAGRDAEWPECLGRLKTRSLRDQGLGGHGVLDAVSVRTRNVLVPRWNHLRASSVRPMSAASCATDWNR